MTRIDALLERMSEFDASDLHLKVDMKPRFRIEGKLHEVAGTTVLDSDGLTRLITEILTPEQRNQFEHTNELDFAYGDREKGRYRINCFRDYWGPAAVFRRIPAKVPTLAELQLPASVQQFAHLSRGLVLVTGATGSGKSSSLAALIDLINENYRRHVITLEDPIEYLHSSKHSVIHQRGLHYDINDFQSGIVAACREDPDVLLIGEMRDLDSIRQAVSAAEIGILVFATLHTNSAASSIDRIIDVFPPQEQPQVRVQLSQSLAGIVSQVLLPRAEGAGRVPATEVLIGNPAVGNIIREGRTQDIATVLQGGKSQGMHTLDDSLEALVAKRIVDPADACVHAHNKPRFERMVRRAESRMGV